MKLLKNCDICGNKKFKFLFSIRDKNMGIPGKFNMVECKKCGLFFINPRPSFKELDKYYSLEEYYFNNKIRKSYQNNKIKFRLFLYNLYFNKNKKNVLLKIMFSPIKFMLRSTKISPNKKILDIGCSSGQFISEMKELGLIPHGIEPINFNSKVAKELNIKKDLIGAKYNDDYFDIITLNHVLEHINNPNEILKEIKRILSPNGYLIIGVPNKHCLAYWIFGKNWYQLDVPRHLMTYSDKLLIKFLKKKEFKIVGTLYNSRPSQFVESLFFTLNIRNPNKIMVKIIEAFFLPLTWVVNSIHLGDQVEVICRKNTK